ncbi:TolC family protein [Flagellimonas lutimaris]|jgi:outer membrane protein TolC|uniref:TolC family protein n=1 Tax=Flagellimonas lutimaris TaxID=475082 RepID=UPI003F5CE5B4
MHSIKYILNLLFIATYSAGFTQEVVPKMYTVDEIVQLALDNNQKLKVSKKSVDIAQQQTKIYRQLQLPDVSFGSTAMYLGDIAILDKDFSKQTTVDMPHFGNTFSFQAQQLIFKGNTVKNTIKIGALQEQLALLNADNDALDIKFLVISNYLDLYKLYNQKQVFEENIKLAQKRIDNVTSLYDQGMVTRNEIVRGDLLLATLNQAVVTIDNNISILNNQLTFALGLTQDTIIIPDEQTLKTDFAIQAFDSYKEEALANHPLVRSIQLQSEMAETSLAITKSEKLPVLAGIAGYNMQRPLTNSFPINDVYFNNWQVGISLTYNIESLYKNNKRSGLEKLKMEQVSEVKTLTEQNLHVAVKAAYLKYNEAISQRTTYMESKHLAEENYKIIEKKYLNQLALITDMLDASNSKLEAELQFVNSEINIIYAYYNILKTVGNL